MVTRKTRRNNKRRTKRKKNMKGGYWYSCPEFYNREAFVGRCHKGDCTYCTAQAIGIQEISQGVRKYMDSKLTGGTPIDVWTNIIRSWLRNNKLIVGYRSDNKPISPIDQPDKYRYTKDKVKKTYTIEETVDAYIKDIKNTLSRKKSRDKPHPPGLFKQYKKINIPLNCEWFHIPLGNL